MWLIALLVVVGVLLVLWVAGLIRLYRGVGRARAFWSRPRGPEDGLLYVALGDSAAQGVGASKPQSGYVSLIADRLAAATGQPVRLVNLSASGARIGDALDRQLPAMHGLRPSVVTVAIGGNDVRGFDSTFFARQIERLTAALPPGTFIADVPYFMHGRWERDSQQAADVVQAHAGQHCLHVVHLHEALRREGWSAMLTQFAPDWFHPNDRGHRVWADAFWVEISKSMPRARDTAGRAAP